MLLPVLHSHFSSPFVGISEIYPWALLRPTCICSCCVPNHCWSLTQVPSPPGMQEGCIFCPLEVRRHHLACFHQWNVSRKGACHFQLEAFSCWAGLSASSPCASYTESTCWQLSLHQPGSWAEPSCWPAPNTSKTCLYCLKPLRRWVCLLLWHNLFQPDYTEFPLENLPSLK